MVGTDWENFLHDLIAGVTGLPNDLVRLGWQQEPPNTPPIDADWAAFRIVQTTSDWQPAIRHKPDGDGTDIFQRHSVSTVRCTFYGPNAEANASLLRDGVFIDQNQATLRANGMGIVECGDHVNVPEFVRGRWWNRVDTDLVIRREVRREYPVLNILRSTGTVTGNGPGDDTVESHFDTGDVP